MAKQQRQQLCLTQNLFLFLQLGLTYCLCATTFGSLGIPAETLSSIAAVVPPDTPATVVQIPSNMASSYPPPRDSIPPTDVATPPSASNNQPIIIVTGQPPVAPEENNKDDGFGIDDMFALVLTSITNRGIGGPPPPPPPLQPLPPPPLPYEYPPQAPAAIPPPPIPSPEQEIDAKTTDGAPKTEIDDGPKKADSDKSCPGYNFCCIPYPCFCEPCYLCCETLGCGCGCNCANCMCGYENCMYNCGNNRCHCGCKCSKYRRRRRPRKKCKKSKKKKTCKSESSTKD